MRALLTIFGCTVLAIFSATSFANEQELRAQLKTDRLAGHILTNYIFDEEVLTVIDNVAAGEKLTTDNARTIAKAYFFAAISNPVTRDGALVQTVKWFNAIPESNEPWANFKVWEMHFKIRTDYQDGLMLKHTQFAEVLDEHIKVWFERLNTYFSSRAVEMLAQHHWDRAEYLERRKLGSQQEINAHLRKSLDYYRKLLPSPRAALRVGYAYWYGLGTREDQTEALAYFSSALTGSKDYWRFEMIQKSLPMQQKQTISQKISQLHKEDPQSAKMILKYFITLSCERLTQYEKWQNTPMTLLFFAQQYKKLFPDDAAALFEQLKSAEMVPVQFAEIV